MERASQASAIGRLVDQFSRLPGIGKRSAERLAFHMLKQSDEQVMDLSRAIADLKKNTKQCAVCFNITETDPCPICADPQRDKSLIMVVEQPNDVVTMEQTGLYRGVYHVLMGRLVPLEGIGPGDLTIENLLGRVRTNGGGEESIGSDESVGSAASAGGAKSFEVIIGTSANIEGDGTALHLCRELMNLGVRVTRLARGMPYGVNMEMLSKAVLADALQGRQPVE